MIQLSLFKKTMISLLMALATSVSYAENNDVTDAIKNQTIQAGKYVNDATLTTKVKATLAADSDIESLKISVTTVHGIVTLSGTVNNVAQKEKVLNIVSHIDNVQGVKDNLHVLGDEDTVKAN